MAEWQEVQGLDHAGVEYIAMPRPHIHSNTEQAINEGSQQRKWFMCHTPTIPPTRDFSINYRIDVMDDMSWNETNNSMSLKKRDCLHQT